MPVPVRRAATAPTWPPPQRVELLGFLSPHPRELPMPWRLLPRTTQLRPPPAPSSPCDSGDDEVVAMPGRGEAESCVGLRRGPGSASQPEVSGLEEPAA